MNIATIFEEVVMNNGYWKTSLVGSYSLLPVAIEQATMIVGGNLGIRGWAIYYGEDMAKGSNFVPTAPLWGNVRQNDHFCAYVYIIFFCTHVILYSVSTCTIPRPYIQLSPIRISFQQ